MRADGKNLSLTFGIVEVACVATSIMLDGEDADADRVTFHDVITGNNKRWFFTISGLPDYAPGTFWTLLWETPAFTPISFLFRPYGNVTPTPEQPHFAGFVTIDNKPPLGGDAGKSWTFSTRLTCVARPARLTAAAA
jgi:hypothetical protein